MFKKKTHGEIRDGKQRFKGNESAAVSSSRGLRAVHAGTEQGGGMLHPIPERQQKNLLTGSKKKWQF